MSEGCFADAGPVGWLWKGPVAIKSMTGSKKGRLNRILLLALIVLVQLAWGTALVYLAVHFL